MTVNIFEFLEKHGLLSFPKKDKFYLLNYIRAISNSGQDEKLAIKNKINEYKKRKRPILSLMLKTVHHEIEKGKPFADSLYSGGILSKREYFILKTSKGRISNGIDKILEISSRAQKSKLAFTLALTPPGIIITGLYLSHGSVKEVLNKMLEPIKSAGANPPPIPNYLLDDTTYLVGNIIFYSLVVGGFLIMQSLKRTNSKLYFQILPISEEEYSLEILSSIEAVMRGGGLNLANTAKALLTGERDPIKKNFYNEIIKRAEKGKIKLSEILEEFGFNYNSVSSLKIGEDSNDIDIGLSIALEDLRKRYERDSKRFVEAGKWFGQLSMIFIAMKPIVDIMLLMSIQQLNFSM